MDSISLSLQIQQPTQHQHQQKPTIPTTNNLFPPPPSSSAGMLHSVRKPPAKPWRRPEQPPPKVYHVDPRGFRKLVQKLTGAPKRTTRPNTTYARPLRDTVVPPPPLVLAPRALPPPPPPPPPPAAVLEYNWPQVQTNHKSPADKGSTGMPSLSLPSPYAWWCSFPLMSPGTTASLEVSSSPIL